MGTQTAELNSSPLRLRRETGSQNRAAAIQRRTQFVVHVNGDREAPWRALEAARRDGLEVLAHRQIREAAGATWLLVTNDDWLAERALVASGCRYETETVLLVNAAPREQVVAALMRQFAESNVEVLYSYATPSAEDRFVAVFKTADDERIVRELQTALPAAADPIVTRMAA